MRVLAKSSGDCVLVIPADGNSSRDSLSDDVGCHQVGLSGPVKGVLLTNGDSSRLPLAVKAMVFVNRT